MGCDITIRLERLERHPRICRWVHDPLPRVLQSEIERRCYPLFCEMCDGVRGSSETAISPARGVPGDASIQVRDEAASGLVGAHTWSWLSLRELAEHEWPEEVSWHPFATFVRWLRDSGVPLDGVRFVFWFDS